MEFILAAGQRTANSELIEIGRNPMPTPSFAPHPRFQRAAIVARDLDAAWRRLMAFQPVSITIGGPQRLPERAGSVAAFKFRDPDGHSLELIAFPVGTGDPRLERPTDSLTLDRELAVEFVGLSA